MLYARHLFGVFLAMLSFVTSAAAQCPDCPAMVDVPLSSGLLRFTKTEVTFDQWQSCVAAGACRGGQDDREVDARAIRLIQDFALALPSLRSRSDEISSLASLYLGSLNLELGKQISGFEPRAIEMLRQGVFAQRVASPEIDVELLDVKPR